MWDEKYDKDEWHYGKEPNDFLKSCEGYFKEGQRVLCLGAGEGRNALYLLQKGLDVDAIDLSPVGLAKLHKTANDLGLSLLTVTPTDVMDYHFMENEYDLITAIWFHGPDQFKDYVFKNVKKALKPGGYFLVEAYRPEQLNYKTGGPPSADLMYTKSQLEESFSDFNIVKSEELEREIQEGVGHSGQSAVVQFLAKKRSN